MPKMTALTLAIGINTYRSDRVTLKNWDVRNSIVLRAKISSSHELVRLPAVTTALQSKGYVMSFHRGAKEVIVVSNLEHHEPLGIKFGLPRGQRYSGRFFGTIR